MAQRLANASCAAPGDATRRDGGAPLEEPPGGMTAKPTQGLVLALYGKISFRRSGKEFCLVLLNGLGKPLF
jgi:hypothetical protein